MKLDPSCLKFDQILNLIKLDSTESQLIFVHVYIDLDVKDFRSVPVTDRHSYFDTVKLLNSRTTSGVASLRQLHLNKNTIRISIKEHR